MKSWNDMKKRLEEDFLAPALRGRVTYFMTRYTHAHDQAGRVAVRVDGREVLTGNDMERWWCSDPYEKEARRLHPELAQMQSPEEKWDCLWNAITDLGCFSRDAFYDAYETFENQSVEESLHGKNGLVRLFALLDRRVGKRRLKTLWESGWGREPAWLLPFLRLRLEAEGIGPGNPPYEVVAVGSQELLSVADLAGRLWEHPAEDMTADFSALLENPDAALFAAKAGVEVIGFSQCQLRHDYVEGTSSSPVGYLEGIFVDEAHRKQGVAAALLEACEAWARSRGCREFASDCELDNVQSQKFHAAMHFEEANRIVCFTKQLSDP